MPQEQKPLFKLVDHETEKSVLVLQAADLAQAEQRLAVLLQLFGNADWFPESANMSLEEHPHTDPIQVHAYLEGYFAVLAFCGGSVH